MLELLLFAVAQPQVSPVTIQPVAETRRVECPNSDRRGPAGICLPPDDGRDASKSGDSGELLKGEGYQPPDNGGPERSQAAGTR